MPDFSHSSFEQVVMERLVQLQNSINTIHQKVMATSTDLSALTTEVANNTAVVASVQTLIQNLATAVQNAGTDPAALAALVTQLQTNDAALAAAVVANTPAASSTPADLRTASSVASPTM